MQNDKQITLIDPRHVAPGVHALYVLKLAIDGITERIAPWGDENLAVEWGELSERAQEWNVDMVETVLYVAAALSPRFKAALLAAADERKG